MSDATRSHGWTPGAEADRLARLALALRRDIVEAFGASGGGHYGGCLSIVEILLTLYDAVLNHAPADPSMPGRDRLILSKGHAAMALYAVLRRKGYFDTPLATYGRFGSGLEGHPDLGLPGVEFPTGSLGQGLAVGLGMALTLRDAGPRVWVVLGDGECQEGQVWEAAMLASRYRSDRLHAVVDLNGHQEYGWPGAQEPLPEAEAKWVAFGWDVYTADGHDCVELASVFRSMTSTLGRPSVCLARTVKGRGIPEVAGDPGRYHCTSVTPEEHERLLRALSAMDG